MVQGGMSCIKYLMFVFNFLFVVCGIALIAIGAVAYKEDFTTFLNSKYVTAPTILIVVGVIIFVIAFLGCCGAVRENHCMVMLFGILLFLIFVIEIAGGITAYVYKGEVEDLLKKNMESSIHQEKEDSRKLWNEMEYRLKCCGVVNVTSYDPAKIPPSCCPQIAEKPVCTAAEAYPDGCFEILLGKFNSKIAMVGGVAIGIAIVELIGVMMSWCLAAAIKKEYEGV